MDENGDNIGNSEQGLDRSNLPDDLSRSGKQVKDDWDDDKIINLGVVWTRRKPGQIQEKIERRKELFLRSYIKSKGIVTVACQNSGVSYTSYKNYRNEDEDFDMACRVVEDTAVDFVESRLMQNIEKGYEASIFFYLKSKGRHRGYGDETVIRGAGGSAGDAVARIKEATIEELEDELRRLQRADDLAKSEEENEESRD